MLEGDEVPATYQLRIGDRFRAVLYLVGWNLSILQPSLQLERSKIPCPTAEQPVEFRLVLPARRQRTEARITQEFRQF